MAQDVQILPFATHAAPSNWTIPDALRIQIKAIEALYDGSGAGSDFLPAVEILSDSGHSVGIFPTDTAVAAGGSATVTFAPFLRNAAAGSAGAQAYWFTATDSGGFAVSGVPKTVRFSALATDGFGISFGIAGSPVDEPILLSASYLYTFTVKAQWDAFVGDRTLTAGTTNGETAWYVPATVTNGDDVQTLTGLVRLDATAPTNLEVTMAQSTGVNQTWGIVSAVLQAVGPTV